MTDQPERIGVVGAGLMGAEIAFVFALAGHQVRLSDRTDAVLAAALDRLDGIYDKGIGRGFYEESEKAAVLSRIEKAVGHDAFADCDFVTEAVFENIELKTEVFDALDKVCKPSCILASNTSTIPISTLASSVSDARRGNFLGTHYFSPVSRMRLVEIIPTFDTTPETVATARRLCEGADKTAVTVKDVAGFLVNRLVNVFLTEAVRLVEEEVATPEEIGLACRLGFGHPIGPFKLMDVVTSRLVLEAQEIMQEAYGERFRPRPLLKQRVRAGLIGGSDAKGWLD